MTQEFHAKMMPLLSGSNNVDLVDMITEIFSLIQNNAELCLITLSPNGDKNFLFRLVAIGKEACMHAYLYKNPHWDPQVMDYFYTFISSGCIAILEQWLKEGMQVPVEEMARIVKGFIAGGAPFAA